MGYTFSPGGGGKADAMEGMFTLEERMRFVLRLKDGEKHDRALPGFGRTVCIPYCLRVGILRFGFPVPIVRLDGFSDNCLCWYDRRKGEPTFSAVGK